MSTLEELRKQKRDKEEEIARAKVEANRQGVRVSGRQGVSGAAAIRNAHISQLQEELRAINREIDQKRRETKP